MLRPPFREDKSTEQASIKDTKRRRQTYRESTVGACAPSILTAQRAAQDGQLRRTAAAIRAQRFGALRQEAPQGAPQQPMPYVRTRTARRRPPPPRPHRAARGRGARPLLHYAQPSERCSRSGAGAEPRADGAGFGPAFSGYHQPPLAPHRPGASTCSGTAPGAARCPNPALRTTCSPRSAVPTRSGTKRALHAASPLRRAAAVR